MPRTSLIASVATFCLSILASTSSAPASSPWSFWGNYPGFPAHGVYSTYINGRPPYFAEFPPVYYSHPVYRSYGLYPFAYTCTCEGTDIRWQGGLPGAVGCKHCGAAPACCSRGAGTPKAVEPLVVRNPYVELPADESGDEVADRRAGPAAPAVVFPTALAK